MQLMTFAMEEVGDTPSSPCLVKATPKAEKKRLIINNVYRLISSDFVIRIPLLNKHCANISTMRRNRGIVKHNPKGNEAMKRLGKDYFDRQ